MEDSLTRSLRMHGLKVVRNKKRPGQFADDSEAMKAFTESLNVEKPDIIVSVSPMKSGKTWSMCGIAMDAVKKGKNTLLVSLEDGSLSMSKKMYAKFLGLPMEEAYQKDEWYFHGKMQEYIKENPNYKETCGYLTCRFPKPTLTLTEMETLIDKAMEQSKREVKGFEKFDVVVIDSIGAMTDGKDSDNVYEKTKNICGGLRKMAHDKDFILVCSTNAINDSVANDCCSVG